MNQRIKLFFFFVLIFFAPPRINAQSKPLILLSAHGDAQTPGRTIKTDLEREQAHAFVYALGKRLQKKGGYALALTHEKTDTPEPWQIVSLTNRFNADLLLKFYVYHSQSSQPHLSLHYLTYNPLTETSYRTASIYSLIPFKRSHLASLYKTKHYAQLIQESLDRPINKKHFSLSPPLGIPLKSLAGLTVPALAIELGINEPDQWKQLVKPLAHSLDFLLSSKDGDIR